jgi:DNA-directed RNA polymerase subunit H (RpoH/RPB5)
MHQLQSKHVKLKKEEVEKLAQDFNISVVQLPKISKDDVSIPKDCDVGDVLLIERIIEDNLERYYRVVS